MKVIDMKNEFEKAKNIPYKSIKTFLYDFVEIKKENIERTEDILGSNFREMYAFFVEYCFEFTENTYTVLLTRRCTALAAWFFRLICENLKEQIQSNFEINEFGEDGLISIKNLKTSYINILISDKYLETKNSLNSEYKYVVLDDICIHGRHINEVADSLEISSNSCKVAYMLSLDSVFKNIDDYYIGSKGDGWVRLSNSIVDVIHFYNIPYVSYLSSYTHFNMEMGEFQKLLSSLKKNKNLAVINYSGDNQSELQSYSYLITECKTKLSYYERLNCLRLYYNCNTKIMSLIPYVLFKPLSHAAINKLFAKYVNKDVTNDILNLSTKYSVCHKHRLLSCISSFSFGLYFCKTYMPEIKWEYDYYHILQLSFGTRVLNKVLNPNNYIISEHKDLVSDIKKFKNQFREYKVELKNKETEIKHFLKKQWLYDEVDACYQESKEKKVPISKFLDTDKPINPIHIAAILKLCDRGYACINIEQSNLNKNYYEDVLDVGELGVNIVNEKQSRNYEENRLIHFLRKASDYYFCLLK